MPTEPVVSIHVTLLNVVVYVFERFLVILKFEKEDLLSYYLWRLNGGECLLFALRYYDSIAWFKKSDSAPTCLGQNRV